MKRFLAILMIVALGVFLVAGSASALSIRLTEGANQVVVADGGGGDVNPNPGAVTFIGSVGTFNINVSTGLSKPAVGNPPIFVEMDLNSVNTSTGAGGTLLIELSDNGFTLNAPGATFGFVASIGGTTEGTLDFYNTYIDYADGLFVQGALITSQGPFVPPPPGFSDTATGTVASDPDLFSLTQVVQMTHPASGQGTRVSSFDANLRSVPEPGTLLLIGTGLIGLAGLGRRKLRKK